MVLASAAAVVPWQDVKAQSIVGGSPPPFTLPSLPYGYDALEPQIDARTMQIHHDEYHAAFVANLNRLASQFAGPPDWSVERVVENFTKVPEKIREAVRNNSGGHYNHSLFWQMMKQNGGGEPGGELAVVLHENFGGFDRFKEAFTKAATGLFGDGWVWLTLDAGKLRIETTANEDTPLSGGRQVLLGVDLWEHAYYQKYETGGRITLPRGSMWPTGTLWPGVTRSQNMVDPMKTNITFPAAASVAALVLLTACKKQDVQPATQPVAPANIPQGPQPIAPSMDQRVIRDGWSSSQAAAADSVEGQLRSQGKHWTKTSGEIKVGAYVQDILEGRLGPARRAGCHWQGHIHKHAGQWLAGRHGGLRTWSFAGHLPV